MEGEQYIFTQLHSNRMPKCECSTYGSVNRKSKINAGFANVLASISVYLCLKVQLRAIVQHSSTLYKDLQTTKNSRIQQQLQHIVFELSSQQMPGLGA